MSRDGILLFLLLGSSGVAGAETLWPVESTESNHWLMTTKELQSYSGDYLHAGFDIPIDVGLNTVVTVAGEVIAPWGCSASGQVSLVVLGDDGRHYEYAHLDGSKFTSDLITDCADNRLEAGTRIGPVVTWSTCASASHLHYEVYDSAATTTLDPYTSMFPFIDHHPPVIEEVQFCDDIVDDYGTGPGQTTTPWQNCNKPTTGCARIFGDVDIITRINERNGPVFSGRDSLVAPARLSYRLCSAANPDCNGWVDAFDLRTMPKDWSIGGDPLIARAMYSLRVPFRSQADYCSTDRFWYVASNVDAGKPDPLGRMTLLPGGGWQNVTIRAEDYAGNVTEKTYGVCDGFMPKLVIRDCVDDNGGEPSNCQRSSDSLDIGIAPARGSSRRMDVKFCMTNMGSSQIGPHRTVYGVALVAHRTPSVADMTMPTDNPVVQLGSWEIPVRLMTVENSAAAPTSPWVVGQRRCYATTAALPPRTSHQNFVGQIVFVYVGMIGDLPHLGLPVAKDNNLASKTWP